MGESSATTGLEAVYVGTLPSLDHHNDPARLAFGVYLLEPAGESGALTETAMVDAPAPAWIARHASGRFLYAGNEVGEFEGKRGGLVTAYSLDPETGAPTPLNYQQTVEIGACYCGIDHTGRWVLATTYQPGAVYVFPILDDGSIGPVSDSHAFTGGSNVVPFRQKDPHAHSVTISPDSRFAMVPDLGSDAVWVFHFDAEHGRLAAADTHQVYVAPGSGPRHLTFSLDSKFVYLLNELSATVITYAYDAETGGLTELQTLSTLPEGFTGFRSGSEIGMHPSGRFVYASNRSSGGRGRPEVPGEDSIVCFAVDAETGMLTETSRVDSGGEIPRHFAIDRAGERMYVANQASNLLTIFEIDQDTGELTPVGTADVPVPTCVQLVED